MWLSIAAAQVGRPECALTQVGQRLVPEQRVALDLHPVRGGEARDRVGAGEVEDARLALGGIPLHLVLGGDVVEVARERVA